MGGAPMPRRLYLAVSPLPAEGNGSALLADLKKAFPDPKNAVYLDGLTGTPERPALPRVVRARLSALSLLPTLLAEAGIPSGIPPGALLLERDGQGRPFCHTADGAVYFDFNLSHSCAHVACALLTGGGRVGVDVEEPVPPARAEPLIRRYCTAGERERLNGLSPEEAAAVFTRIWTVREAIAKQDGRGMPLRFDAAAPPAGLRICNGILPDTHASVTLCMPVDGDGTEALPVLSDDSLPVRWMEFP